MHCADQFGRADATKPGHRYNNRGNAYTAKGEYDRGIQDYDTAIMLKPDFAEAFNNRGNAYEELGKHDRAIKDYDVAITLDPKNALAYFNRGIAHREVKGDPDKAVADFTQAIRLDAKNGLAFYNRGLAYYDRRELDRAIAEPVDVLVQGVRLARGEVVVVNNHFAIRLKEIVEAPK